MFGARIVEKTPFKAHTTIWQLSYQQLKPTLFITVRQETIFWREFALYT